MQTTLQRHPRNSVEQLGQIEAASAFGFAGGFGGKPVVVVTATVVVEARDKIPVEFAVELISGVVAQIEPRENMRFAKHQCEPWCDRNWVPRQSPA
ncbi:MAG: hypothetical protein WAJ97_02660 [Terriglobales bacterium]